MSTAEEREASRQRQERHRRRKGVRPRTSDEHKAWLSEHNPMNDPDAKAKISGDLSPTKRPEVRAKIAAAAYRGTKIGYHAAHKRADKVLPRECAMADDTCKGRPELAFRHDAPAEFVRPYTGRLEQYQGRLYYVGPDSADGYMRLCSSHHQRYDQEGGTLP